ncbi:MAG: alkaline phosphatase family protein, partial [Chitinophagales bacterium]
MRNRAIILLGICLQSVLCMCQTVTPPPQPKLVVGIVVDQMAYEFLYRYADKYGSTGFQRLMQEGYNCADAHYNYIPTYTGPGHASIYTGSIPAINGIVSNDWYDRNTKSYMYVTSDSTVHVVGPPSITNNMQSPANMLTTTITDMLKLSDQQRSKVIGIALKDRGAILPAGHSADAAYWYDGYANAWVSSSYYMDTLPQWVQDVNATVPAEKYLNRNWDLFLPPTAYTNATADSVDWETKYIGEASTKFPHYLLFQGISEIIKSTPFGNSLTEEFAEAVIRQEGMGKHSATDFLCVSFSSTDYVGHAYGPHSVEIEDTYIRLDRDLGKFLHYLDEQVGKGNYVLFLTADHGVAPVPQYMQSLQIPSGSVTAEGMLQTIKAIADRNLGADAWIEAYTNQQIYLNDSTVQAHHFTKQEVFHAMQSDLQKINGVAFVLDMQHVQDATLPSLMRETVINGIYPKRCGDIQLLFDPYWIEAYRPTGTTH